MVAIQLIGLTSNGEEAIRKYVEQVQDYAKKHPIKVRMVEKAKNPFVQEDYEENPMRIIVTIKKEDVNLAMYITQIETKLNAIMNRYNVSKEDYFIEVL